MEKKFKEARAYTGVNGLLLSMTLVYYNTIIPKVQGALGHGGVLVSTVSMLRFLSLVIWSLKKACLVYLSAEQRLVWAFHSAE